MMANDEKFDDEVEQVRNTFNRLKNVPIEQLIQEQATCCRIVGQIAAREICKYISGRLEEETDLDVEYEETVVSHVRLCINEVGWLGDMFLRFGSLDVGDREKSIAAIVGQVCISTCLALCRRFELSKEDTPEMKWIQDKADELALGFDRTAKIWAAAESSNEAEEN